MKKVIIAAFLIVATTGLLMHSCYNGGPSYWCGPGSPIGACPFNQFCYWIGAYNYTCMFNAAPPLPLNSPCSGIITDCGYGLWCVPMNDAGYFCESPCNQNFYSDDCLYGMQCQDMMPNNGMTVCMPLTP